MRAFTCSLVALSPHLARYRIAASAHAALPSDAMRCDATPCPTQLFSLPLPIAFPDRESVSAHLQSDWALCCGGTSELFISLPALSRDEPQVMPHTPAPPPLAQLHLSLPSLPLETCLTFLSCLSFFKTKIPFFSPFQFSLLQQANHYYSCQCCTYRIHSNIFERSRRALPSPTPQARGSKTGALSRVLICLPSAFTVQFHHSLPNGDTGQQPSDPPCPPHSIPPHTPYIPASTIPAMRRPRSPGHIH